MKRAMGRVDGTNQHALCSIYEELEAVTVHMFMIAAAVVMFVLSMLALRSLRYVFDGNAYKAVYRGLLAFDMAAVAGMAIGPFFLHDAFRAGPVIRIISVVFVTQFFLSVLVGIAVVLRWAGRRLNAPMAFSRSRRQLLKRAMVYPAAAMAAAGYGGTCGVDGTVEREYQIPVRDLPENLRGFRIAQLSDVHLGMFFSLERLKELLRQAAKGKPDALVLTGDIFDDVALNPEAIQVLDSFTGEFPYGIWYCNGNHEHFRGIERIQGMLAETQIHSLVNSSETVVEGARPLVFLGVDYPMKREEKVFQSDKRAFMEAAMHNVPGNAVKVLLAHHPEFIDNGAEKGIELTLAGHTHGSQFGILGIPVFPVFKYTRGMVQHGECYGYVHCGNGSWFPYRIGCPPEIAYFTLRRG